MLVLAIGMGVAHVHEHLLSRMREESDDLPWHGSDDGCETWPRGWWPFWPAACATHSVPKPDRAAVDLGLITAILLSLVAAWALLIVVLWLLRPKGVPLREVIRVVPAVLRLLRSIITDRTAPKDVRLVIGVLFAWIISPIDLIPEFIPVIGPFDDVVVAILALRYVRRRLGNRRSAPAVVGIG